PVWKVEVRALRAWAGQSPGRPVATGFPIVALGARVMRDLCGARRTRHAAAVFSLTWMWRSQNRLEWTMPAREGLSQRPSRYPLPGRAFPRKNPHLFPPRDPNGRRRAGAQQYGGRTA